MCQGGPAVCATCGFWVRATTGVELDGRTYCCQGCAIGGPCYCSYDLPETRGHDESPEPRPT
jgi:hypothetical protein